MDYLQTELYKWFGLTEFRSRQEQIISAVLNKRDTFAMLATGSGKSLCYQLPALIQDGLTVVVSPLLSLMQNQVQELKAKKIKQAAAFNSFLSSSEKKDVLLNIKSLKILYISPESLQQKEVLQRLSSINIFMLAVDEAHCISQWGHEFRTDYLEIGKVRSMLGYPVCLALTATATSEVKEDIKKHLHMREPLEVSTSVDRPNISLEVLSIDTEHEKQKQLLSFVKSMAGPGLVYVSSRKKAEQLAAMLHRLPDISAAAYHGGMSSEDRILIQQQFLNDHLHIICCTNAFGMGVNKNNIRFIVHYHYPKDLESFVQEVGRAGRDGLNSAALLLNASEDHVLPRLLIEKEFPDDLQMRQALLDWPEISSLKKIPLRNYFLEKLGWEEQSMHFFLYYIKKRIETHGKLEVEETLKYLLSIISNRKNKKKAKLEYMERWINSSTCRRSSLLRYFNETPGLKVENCCDICGIAVRESVNKEHKYNSIDLSWKEELKEIFHFVERADF
ncbi:RecQ family ATP-dependent DNA helicase [Alteribacillus sp. HJP-4]|uniref:RecQ family ATP-dependent DNA helicase n=1 Tax=Alteribacillus sp. HJP-4 TaxID=2775394 RepID=UPI0035CCE85F